MKPLTTNGIELDLAGLDLDSVAKLQGSALATILDELKEESQSQILARHSSHSSYSTHGTAAW